MIDVEETPDGLRAIDLAKNEVEVELDGWDPGGEELEIDRRVDVTVSGSVKAVRIPHSASTIEEKDGSTWRLARSDGRADIERGEYLIQADNSMTLFIRTDAAFELRQDHERDETVIAFPERTELTFGFRSFEKIPDDRIRIPPTPEGMATALSAMGEYHETGTPDRSYPSMRLHPPLIEVDETSRLHEPRPDSEPSVRIELPRSIEDLFVVAPLAYYLSAEVIVSDVPHPSVVTEIEQIRPPVGTSVPDWAGSLLKRVFYLDCLVRNAGPYGAEIKEISLLDDISVDTDDLYELPIDRRMTEYLEVDFERIADGFPPWSLSVFVDPRPSNIPTLPYLLNKLALVRPPDSDVMDQGEFISRSLDDFQRSRGVVSLESANDGPILHAPRGTQSLSQAWIADGAVADGFKCPPISFSNNLTRRGERPAEISVAVVLNEGGMDAELADVIQTYRRRGEDLPLSIQADSHLRKGELQDVFESPHDYVHYIGHCDDEGLRCADGHLSLDALEESRAKMFFLNACDSYWQGLNLIRKGSIAGTVTTSDVIDEQARKVGATLAKLLTLGFSFDRSVRLARRRSIMNRQYIVLGDGTRSLTQGECMIPSIAKVRQSTDGYSIQFLHDRADFHGGLFMAATDFTPVLTGNPNQSVIKATEFCDFLEISKEPVIYEDALYWPDELLEELF